MVIIETFVYGCIASMMVFCLNVINKARLAKKADFIYFGVILSLIITQTFIQISPEIRGSIHTITYICLGTIFALALTYFITRRAVSTPEIHENIRGWIVWTMFLVLGISFCMLLIKLPDTKVDLFRIPLALALCIGIAYYPPVLDRLKASRNGSKQHPGEHKEAFLDTAAAIGIEKHKEAVINLTIESWRLAKAFELAITQLNLDKPRRYTNRIEWFIKKAEESLEKTDLRIVNLEGYSYDPGMAAAPVNLEEFDVDDSLVVSLMVEPIIMDGTVLVKRGKISLMRIES